jgi:hypothetical protein
VRILKKNIRKNQEKRWNSLKIAYYMGTKAHGNERNKSACGCGRYWKSFIFRKAEAMNDRRYRD